MNRLISCVMLVLVYASCASLKSKKPQLADKPLFRDPVYDGAADPVLVFNQQKENWYMFYTNRRANEKDLDGVSWVHGTRIGIAESKDGVHWNYVDTANI